MPEKIVTSKEDLKESEITDYTWQDSRVDRLHAKEIREARKA